MKTTTTIKSVCLFASLLLFHHKSIAQISMGFKTGVTFGSIDYPVSGYTGKTSNNIGPNLGLQFECRLAKFLAIQPEINYIQKGAIFAESGTNNYGTEWSSYSYRSQIKLNYLELPVLIKSGYNKDKFGINVIVGPGIGLCLNGKIISDESYIDSDGESESYHSEDEDWVRDLIKYLDLTMNVGLETSLKMGNNKLFAECRYQFSLIDITDGYNMKNKGIQAAIGYRILISKPKH